MKHTIVYNGTTKEQEIKALKDVYFWLGDRFDEVVKEIRLMHAEGSTQEQIVACLSFAGIQGLPAQVLAKIALKK